MSNSPNKQLQLILEKRKNQLVSELGAAYKQKGYPINEVERERNDSLINDLQIELEDLDNKLLNLLNSINNPQLKRNLDDQFQKDIPKIDFKEAVKIINNFKSLQIDRRNAILLLLQDTYTRAGKYCIARIKNELGDIAHEIPVKLTSDYNLLENVLDSLAGYVGVEERGNDLNKYAQIIAEKLCQRACTGSNIFIEINNWGILKKPIDDLNWFISNFWHHLLECSPNSLRERNHSKVRFIVVITSEQTSAFSQSKTSYVKKWQNFDEKSVFELVLEKTWKENYIKCWLENYSHKYKECNDIKINEITKYIYDISKIPTDICAKLEEEMIPKQNN